jgi:UDP-GlcNAc:undecaprenyl-phosphate GlcNAc-1-phosphate transferase
MVAVGLGLAGVSLALSVGLCALVRVLAPRVGFVDRPGGRKAHKRPTPLGGGVAIWATVVGILGAGAFVAWVAPDGSLPEPLRTHVGGLRLRLGELATLLGLATVLMLMGLADDRRPLPWKPRLALQLGMAAAVVLAFDYRITLFLPPGPFNNAVSDAVTVLWIVALTNAFNFLDNMDGLAASVGLVAAVLFAIAQAMVGGLFVPAVLLVLAGALGGFLVHNWAPARLFMGDAGSNFLGFLLGSLTVAGTFSRPYEGRSSVFAAFSPLLVLAVPLYDMTSVILIRLSEGRSPFQPDRRHFSHRLVERGLTPPGAVATIDLVTLACGLGALILPRADGLTAALVVAQVVCLIGVVAVLESAGRRVPASVTSPPPESEPADAAAIEADGPPRPAAASPTVDGRG